MSGSLVAAILVLPGTVLVYVPAAILWSTSETGVGPALAGPLQVRFWLALVIGGLGVAVMAWTVSLFLEFGEGTPAPWDPPNKLVVRGPYRHVRNPMITGVLVFLLAEALFFGSWPLAGWMAVVFLANAIYFPLVEERNLERRFGEDYRTYKANVPRWLPRRRGWSGP